MAVHAKSVTIKVSETHRVSGLLLTPPQAHAAYVFAHGAGAGMAHPFMAAVATELADRGIASLRYQFPYMEQGGKRPDPPKLAQAAVRAAVTEAGAPPAVASSFAGGKSFGGRMTSQAQAVSPLPGVRGLAFFGFPLHPAGKPSDERAEHLVDVQDPDAVPAGTRDTLADTELLKGVVKGLGKRATLHLYDDADHSFHVPARSGRKDADVRREILDAFAAWMRSII